MPSNSRIRRVLLFIPTFLISPTNRTKLPLFSKRNFNYVQSLTIPTEKFTSRSLCISLVLFDLCRIVVFAFHPSRSHQISPNLNPGPALYQVASLLYIGNKHLSLYLSVLNEEQFNLFETIELYAVVNICATILERRVSKRVNIRDARVFTQEKEKMADLVKANFALFESLFDCFEGIWIQVAKEGSRIEYASFNK